MSRSFVRLACALAGMLSMPLLMSAHSTRALQAGRAAAPPPLTDDARTAAQLDVAGKTREARVIFQRLIDTAPTPLAKATAQRGMAMSYAFDGDCADTIKYEDMVIAYWATREAAEPQNAFYQQGEMANEGARVCIDNGQFDIAEEYYRRGTDFGLREPEPKTHPKSLWAFRMTHALARLAARRGDAAEAHKQVVEARRILDSDKTMAEAQERFFPYLQGYVELYLNNFPAALTHLNAAVAIPANATDPFMQTLLGMTHEKMGHADQAKAFYQKAYDLATAHNPPSAFARTFAGKKLGK
jgi:tetratricopeptide (TPR) repeat protein